MAIKNEKRREKTANLLFDLVKYILTMIVIGGIFAKAFNLEQAIIGSILSIFIFVIAFFITPPNGD